MMKFGRNYRLTIKDTNDTIITDLLSGEQESRNLGEETATVIEFPITAAFTVKRDTGSSLSDLNIQIYNLSADTRDKIYQDRYSFFSQAKGDVRYRSIVLEAGYGDDLYTIFRGNLYEAGSVRRGTDIITHINARDGGYDTQLTQTFKTLQAPITQKQLVEILAADFPNLTIGAVGDNEIVFNRPVAVSGNTYRILKDYLGKNVFIDLEKLYALEQFQVVETDLFKIDATTGLLETPNRTGSGLTLTVLFEPAISIASRVELASSILPQYNGIYRVNSIKHDCVMSGAVGGECKTTLELLLDGAFFGKKFQTVPLAATRNNT